MRRGIPFTTSFHTKFPEYIAARTPVPVSWGYAFVRWFHRPSKAVLVATKSIRCELEARGFTNVEDWTRGVETDLFRPGLPPALDLPHPVFLYVGRVAVEKNIEAFLDLDLPGSKLVVGGGPDLDGLKERYPMATFTGPKFGEELARHYAAGDVFVFPSRTDTFGLVMLEAMAAGLPAAAYPVPGPLDVVDGAPVGVLDDDLGKAATEALTVDRAACRAHALTYSWDACTDLFLSRLAVRGGATA